MTFDELFAEFNLTAAEREALVIHLATLRMLRTLRTLLIFPGAADHGR